MKKYYWIIIKAICEVGVFPQTNEIKTHTTMNQSDFRLDSRSRLDCLILMIFEELKLEQTKQIIETFNLMQRIKKPKKIFPKYKAQIIEPVQKTDATTFFTKFFFVLYGFFVICLGIVTMTVFITQTMNTYYLKRNIIYNKGGRNFWQINTKTLEKKYIPLILGHKYLIAQEARIYFDKKFFLLKDTGKKTGVEREYEVQESESYFLKFFFENTHESLGHVFYPFGHLFFYNVAVNITFYKKSGEKDREYLTIPIDWSEIEQESQHRYFSDKEDCFQYNDQKITKITTEDINNKINLTPPLTEDAFKEMNLYFYKLLYEKQTQLFMKTESKEIKKPLIECIKIFPKFGEIKDHISSCALKK